MLSHSLGFSKALLCQMQVHHKALLHVYHWFSASCNLHLFKFDNQRKQTPFKVILVLNCPKKQLQVCVILPAGPRLHSPQELHRQTEPGRACLLQSVWPVPSLKGHYPAFAPQCQPAPRQMPGYGLEGRRERRHITHLVPVRAENTWSLLLNSTSSLFKKESHLPTLHLPQGDRIQHTVSYRLHGNPGSILPIALLIELDHRPPPVPLWRV